MVRNCWMFCVLLSIASLYHLQAAEEEGLVNLNIKINKRNLSGNSDDGRVRTKNPFFLNLDIPSIFSMNLDTKKPEGTSLGLRVLSPINRLLSIFGVDRNRKTTEEGWALTRRASKEEGKTKKSQPEELGDNEP